MIVAIKSQKTRKGSKPAPKQMRDDLLKIMVSAKESDHYFLLYLLGMAMQEIGNIEKGTPTPFSGIKPVRKPTQSPEPDE